MRYANSHPCRNRAGIKTNLPARIIAPASATYGFAPATHFPGQFPGSSTIRHHNFLSITLATTLSQPAIFNTSGLCRLSGHTRADRTCNMPDPDYCIYKQFLSGLHHLFHVLRRTVGPDQHGPAAKPRSGFDVRVP